MHLLILLFKPEVKDVTCFTHYRWHISQHLSCLAFILTPSLQFATFVANLLFPYNAYCPSYPTLLPTHMCRSNYVSLNKRGIPRSQRWSSLYATPCPKCRFGRELLQTPKHFKEVLGTTTTPFKLRLPH